jgi:flagellar motor switch protein FliN/FliY
MEVTTVPDETTSTTADNTQKPEGEIKDIMPELESKDPAQSASSSQSKAKQGKSIDAMLNVDMNIQVVLGYSHMPIADLLKLSRDSVIELDRQIGEPVDIIINQSLVARGDLIKVGENRIGISLTEIVKDYIFEN